MRIVIEIEGNQVTVSSPDGVVRSAAGPTMPDLGDAAPSRMPPPGLLERAKKLGAVSAGGAQFGTGAAMATAADFNEPLEVQPPRPRRAKSRTRRGR